MRTFKEYWLGVYKESHTEVRIVYGVRGELIKNLIVIAVLAVSLWQWKGMNFAVESIWSGFWPNIIGILILFFIAPMAAFFNMFRVAALRDKYQRDRLSIKEYEDIEVAQLNYPWTDNDQRIGAPGFYNFFKLGLRVTNNGGVSVRDCSVRLMFIEYSGRSSNNEWVPSPSPVENRMFKWDEGYDIPNGKIDRISPSGGAANLFFAESNRYSQEFRFAFIDGMSKTDQNLEGRYKVAVKLEGEAEKDRVIVDLTPLEFSIEFDFQRRQFFNVLISKLPRIAAEQSVHPTVGIRPAKRS